MDTPALPKAYKINRFLPYWAVFQADLKQNLRSWLFRAWVFLSLAAAFGYMLYRYGAKQVGFIQPASTLISELLTYVVLGTVTIILMLTGGTICSERGTMADSVLSRGISRFQYFFGKWHARLAAILGSYLVMSIIVMVSAYCLLHGESLSLWGAAVAILAVGAILAVVITIGVTLSALVNTTMVSIAIGWMLVNASCFLLSMLPDNYPTPDRMLKNLPNILRGMFDLTMMSRFIGISLGVSLAVALVGMVLFARRDV
ncbi:MAG: ABC transporter permease [Planctomycetes bacterium]|nr:ABC transporter permease [Planctomycetota bacterium]